MAQSHPIYGIHGIGHEDSGCCRRTAPRLMQAARSMPVAPYHASSHEPDDEIQARWQKICGEDLLRRSAGVSLDDKERLVFKDADLQYSDPHHRTRQ